MTTAVQRRRGTKTEHESFTGLEGEITVNTTNESLHVHDGSTTGGFETMRADGSNATSLNLNSTTNVDGVLDEDTLVSNSATKLATQQSIKAYVDGQSYVTDGDKGDVVVSSSGSVWTVESAAGDFDIAASLTVDTNTLYVDSTNNRVGIGTTSPSELLQVNGDARVQELAIAKNVPSDFWASGEVHTSYGYLGSQGGFALSLVANGYRNTSNTWTSLETNGSTAAIVIDLQTSDGDIVFRSDSARASGSGYVPTERMRINSTGLDVTDKVTAAAVQSSANTSTASTTSGLVGGRDDSQYINLHGAAGANFISAVSTSGNPKAFAIRSSTDSGSTYPVQLTFQSDDTGIAVTGDLDVSGALSKNSGSFKIPHPLKPETHKLVHSFVEAPQADLYYRGRVDLVGGKAQVNIDAAAGMTEGTFELLCRDVQPLTSNETSFSHVKSWVEGNVLFVESEESTSTDTISWLVIGERKDQHMYDTGWTDENGHVIVEPLAKIEIERARIIEVELTETITEEKEVTEIEVIDGKAVQKKVIQQVEKQVPVCDELPIVCEKGNPVEDEHGCQCVHKVPRKVKQLEYYTEQVSCETAEELQALQKQAEKEIEELKSSLMAL